MILESLSFATNVQKSVLNLSFQHHFSGIESRWDLQCSEEEVIFFKTNRAVNEGRLDWLTNVYDSSCLRGGKLSGLGDLCGSWRVKRSHLEMSGFQMFSKGWISCSFFVGRTCRIDCIFHDMFGFLQQGRMGWKHFLDYQKTLRNSVLRTISEEILFTCLHSMSMYC